MQNSNQMMYVALRGLFPVPLAELREGLYCANDRAVLPTFARVTCNDGHNLQVWLTWDKEQANYGVHAPALLLDVNVEGELAQCRAYITGQFARESIDQRAVLGWLSMHRAEFQVMQ